MAKDDIPMPKHDADSLEEAYPFEEGESVEAAAERQGEGGGERSMRRSESTDYDPGEAKGSSKAPQ